MIGKYNDISSQKARAYLRYKEAVPYGNFETLDTLLVRLSGKKVERAKVPKSFDSQNRVFVRPCPQNPRHGVLESDAVSWEEAPEAIQKLRRQMRKVEPKGCIIVQPFVDAKFSGVMAPGHYIIVGEGHDGVTAGHGKQYIFPLADAHLWWIGEIGEKHGEVELEFIYKDHRTWLTQIRKAAGHIEVGTPPSEDAFPGFVVGGQSEVKEIFTVYGLENMEELERLVSEPQDGLVVSHPDGSLLSHAAAHCRSTGVSYVVGEVEVGDTITEQDGWILLGDAEPSAYEPSKYSEAFWQGVEYARMFWREEWGRLGIYFHQFISGAINDPDETAFLGGAYVGWLTAGASAAVMGELRHAPAHQEPYKEINMQKLVMMTGFDEFPLHRAAIYQNIQRFDLSWQKMLYALQWASQIFDEGCWEGSYGGRRWRDCSNAAAEVIKAIEKFDLDRTIRKANLLENAAHNSGWLFDKFIEKTYFDIATTGINPHFPNYAFNIHEIGADLLSLRFNRPHEKPPYDWAEVIDEEVEIEDIRIEPTGNGCGCGVACCDTCEGPASCGDWHCDYCYPDEEEEEEDEESLPSPDPSKHGNPSGKVLTGWAAPERRNAQWKQSV